MLARLFVFFGGLLVLALCALLMAPFFVDWAGYRSAFEREASRIIGQPVRVEGEASARILPFPSVTFSNVVIDGPDGTPAARIAAFSMDAELAPFLSGEILIFDMRIDRADVRVEMAENGALLWTWPQSEALKGNTIKLESVNIVDGRMTLEREGLEPILFNGINGKVSAQALTGPWVAEGRFVNGANTYDARLSTSAAVAGETLRARLLLSPQGGFYEAAFDGRLSNEGGTPAYSGQVEMTALGNVQDANGKRQRLATINGDFSANASGLKVNKATLTAGPRDNPYRADGSLNLSFGTNARFDVTLKGQQINFGDIEGNVKGDRVGLSVPLAERLAALKQVLSQIPVPDIPGQIDLALTALVIGDAIIRNAEIKATPAAGGWTIGRYAAELPGRTIVEGDGELAVADELSFSGAITLATKQPTGLANWLGIAPNPAIRALPRAGFSARIDLTANRQIFREIEFRAGNAVLRGQIDRQVAQNARPQMSIRLAGENADLDVLSSLANIALAENASLLAEDMDLSLASEPVSGFGLQAERLRFGVSLLSDAVKIDQVEITGLAGADVRVSGDVAKVFAQPQGLLDVSVLAIDPLMFIDAMAMRFPDQNWLPVFAARAGFASLAMADGTLTAKVNLKQSTEAASLIDANYQFDGAGLRFEGSLQRTADDVSLAAKGEADNGETLLAAFGLPVADALTQLTPLEAVQFELSGLAKNGQVQSGTLKAVANGDVLETGLGPNANPFNIVLADASPYASAAGYALPGSAFGLPLTLKGEWQRTGQTLKLQSLEGAFVEVPFSGQLELALGERPKATGQLKFASLDRIAFDEVALGPLAAAGDNKAEFISGLNLSFDADLLLSAGQLIGFSPLPLNTPSGRLLATKDAMRLTDLKAELAGGQVAGSGEISKNGKEALLRFNGTLSGADFSKIYPNSITGNGQLQIELSAAGSTLESMKTGLTGSGVVQSSGLTLDGVSTAGFASLVGEADARETPPDQIAALALADQKIMLGQLALPQFQTAFTITSGVARAPRSLLNVEGGTLAFEPKLDLNSGEGDIQAQLLFDTENSAATGTEPALNFTLTGPWNALALAIDVQPLQGFLGERALAREEVRVEAIQSALLEKQRLRRENRYYAGLIEARQKAEAERVADIERAAKQAAEEERLKNEQLEKARIEKEKQASENQQNGEVNPTEPTSGEPPLNLDGLIKQLGAPPVQP